VTSPILYRGMDRAALDAAYNNSAAVADSQEWVARWREQSAAIRAQPNAKLDIPYGARPRAKLDYFPAGPARAPLFVFIHGGYWQRNDKDGFSFVAEGPRPHGIDVALVGYTLGPEARITDIVGEMREALTFLAAKASDFGFARRGFSLAAGRRAGTSPRRCATIRRSAAGCRSAAFSTSSRSRSIISTRSFPSTPPRSRP
jgi:arylformamidase